MNKYFFKTGKIKLIFAAFGFLIAVLTIAYTNYLVKELQKKEKRNVELYAKALSYISSSQTDESDLTFLLENIIKPIDLPLIYTDKNDSINIDNLSDFRNIEIDSSLSRTELKKFLQKKVIEMDKHNEPIPILYQNSIVLGKIHYDESALLKSLKYYPYAQISIAALFIIIGYVFFNRIKKIEQSNIWAGMAKETAHQLGTPISSLMGWVEILKLNSTDPIKVLDISNEIENDISRLNIIANRFSKIGSKPEFKNENIYKILKSTVDYFERRLSQLNKKVNIIIEGDQDLTASIESELFAWVIENLIKNSLDAIESKKGKIKISYFNNNKALEIEITDNGKGIDPKKRKYIFEPGFTTKKRGWGLGLSLSKRIIEDLHKGKIFIKNSSSEGTTMKIILKTNKLLKFI